VSAALRAALSDSLPKVGEPEVPYTVVAVADLRAAIAALAEPVAEPIAEVRDGCLCWHIPHPTYAVPQQYRTGRHLLYAAPQAPAVAPNLACKSVQARLAAQWGYVRAPAVALTDEQIDELHEQIQRIKSVLAERIECELYEMQVLPAINDALAAAGIGGGK